MVARRQRARALTGSTSVADGRRPVDKELNNQLRLPLLAHLFPNAQVLHVVRHPLDTMLSSYAHQFDDHPPWSTSLTDMTAYYREAWAHIELARTALAPGNYLRVRYEDLVDDAAAVLRQVTDFLGIAWTPALLDFHTSRRVVRTASYAQVTEPLYRASRFKYRAYLPQLDEDVLHAVEPVVRAMGYAI